MTRPVTAAAMVLSVVMLSGCLAIPTKGPVEAVSPVRQGHVDGGVQVHPAAPQRDASPDVVLAGFLDAMASLEPGLVTARQYLTPEAAKDWRPEGGVVVFDGDTRTSIPGTTTAGIQARVVGTLDRQGRYTPATDRTLRQDFTMEQVDGQWRITDPPREMLVSQYTLLHRYSPTSLWFFAPGGTTMVPERVWLPGRPADPQGAVRVLLQGPSDWLSPAVTSAIPAGTSLRGGTIQVADGLARIDLHGPLDGLDDEHRSQLVSQLGWTLKSFGQVRSMRILHDGNAWMSPGQDADGSISLDDLPGLPPVPLGGDQQPFAVVDGRVGRLDGHGAFSPLGWDLASSVPGQRAGRLAVSSTSATVAVVTSDATRLFTTPLGSGHPRLRLTGTGLGRPAVTATGEVWVSTQDEDGSGLYRSADGRQDLQRVQVPGLSGATVVAFAVAPDQTRLALVLRRGEETELGLLRLYDGRVDGLRILSQASQQTRLEDVIDVAWAGPEQLMVLGRQHDRAQATASLVSVDGSQSEAVGPAGDGPLVQLATRPQLDGTDALVRTDGGRVMRFEAAWRWNYLAEGVADIALPS